MASDNKVSKSEIIYRPVDPILRIPQVKVDKEALINRAVTRYNQFCIDRIEWMRRREQYYLGWDDYLSPARKGLWEGSSNLHLPLTEIQTTVMHALIMQAILFNYPWFYIDPQEDVDVARVRKAERYMKFILERYCNYNKGIYLAIDDWAWDLCSEGIGILSRQWVNKQSRFIAVEENSAFKQQRLDLQKMLEDTEEKDFSKLAKRLIQQPYMEKAIIRTVFNGPVVSAEDPAYVLFKGDVVDSTDLNEHETVMKICYFDEATLQGFAQSEYFDEEATENVLSSTPDRKWSSDYIWGNDRTRRAKDIQSGINTINPMAQSMDWEFLCVYDRWRINPSDRSSVPDRLQYIIHPKTRQLMRWTYQDRVSPNGKLPLHMAHLFRRPRRSIGRGMVQTMWALNETQDILANQTIDAGMLANNPMFGYRGNSTFDPEEVRAEPGLGLKMDDPNNDLRFFNWEVNPNWSAGIQNTISQYAQQLTSINPSNSGSVGPNVGALRSTSGVKALSANASTQQNVIINRAKIAVSECFEGLYSDCVDKMDSRITITVTGAGGIPVFNEDGTTVKEEISKEDLRMRLHFGIYANSQNMNHEMQKEAALAIAQFSFQPIAINSGVITPQNVYEILANIHQTQGTLRPDRFITQPGQGMALDLEWEMRMIMAGVQPPVFLNDTAHAQKIEVMTPLLTSPVAMQEAQFGKVSPNAMAILKSVIDQHQKFLETAQRPSNVQNPTGSNQSPTLAAPTGAESTPDMTTPSPAAKPTRGGGNKAAKVEGATSQGSEVG